MRCDENRSKEASEAAAGASLCRPVPCAGERACSWASALLGCRWPAQSVSLSTNYYQLSTYQPMISHAPGTPPALRQRGTASSPARSSSAG